MHRNNAMRQKLFFTFIIISCFAIQIKAQKTHIAATKCVSISMDYDKKLEYVEFDCAKMQKNTNKSLTTEQLIASEQRKLKLIAYQEKLKSIGYDVTINGIIDQKTITAHNTYLRKKKKEDRKMFREERKKKRSG